MFNEMIAPLLNTQWGRRLGWGVLICMLLLLLITLGETWSDLKDDLALTSRPGQKMTATLSADESIKLITAIPTTHIFGDYGALQQTAIPITSLQLRLVGVIKSVPEKYSRVIISEGDHPGKVYKIGDSLSSGIKIYGITQDGVVLDNGGRLEKLPLQRPPLLFKGRPKPLTTDDNNAQEE